MRFEQLLGAQWLSGRRAHFVPLLTPGALDRVQDEGDWMRREIAHALSIRRRVVPLTVTSFEFPSRLPADHHPGAHTALTDRVLEVLD